MPGAIEYLMKEMGLKTADAYLDWCTQNGFHRTLKKSWADCNQEIQAFKSARAVALLRAARARTLSPRLIKEVCQTPRDFYHYKNLKNPDVKTSDPATQKIAEFAEVAAASGLLASYEAYVLNLYGKNRVFLSLDHIMPPEGNYHYYNKRYLELVLDIFNLRDKWLRDPKDWEPKSHNGVKQLCSLLAHVFTKYPVPTFLYNTWFTHGIPEAHDFSHEKCRDWFILLGQGAGYKDLPMDPIFRIGELGFTKKQAHLVLQAPGHYKVQQAFFYGQIMGMPGGDIRLVEAIIQMDLGQLRIHNHFWRGLFNIFCQNPMLDRNQFGPMYDYVYHQKFQGNPPPNPNFSWQGRTAESLLRQTEQWHQDLALDRRRRGIKREDLLWKPSGLRPLIIEEGDKHKKIWEFRELLDSSELRDEGRAMRHCVSSYDRSCHDGRIAIWSLTCKEHGDIERRHLTIEVNLQSKAITQARQMANRAPEPTQLRIMQDWAAKNGLGCRFY
jgi:hypothetical protein